MLPLFIIVAILAAALGWQLLFGSSQANEKEHETHGQQRQV